MPYWTGLTRADGVEQPHDDDRQAGFVPVGQPEEFVERLGAGKGPAAGGGGADDAVAVFAEGQLVAFAVNLARGGDQSPAAVAEQARRRLSVPLTMLSIVRTG